MNPDDIQHTEVSPRVVTTGGNSVSIIPVSTGESSFPSDNSQEPVGAIAHIDWFAFTVTPPAEEGLGWVHRALCQLIPFLTFEPTGKGWNGYTTRHTIFCLHNDANLGLVAHGGDSQLGSFHVELNAQACALLADWEQVKAWGERCNAKITRVDLAHDDMAGEVVTVDIGLEWLKSGQFSLNGLREGKSAVKARLIDDLGTGDGKTLYVGQRANGKMLRIYEKGKQLGDAESPWVRVEVELRDKSRVIPWDTLIRPSHYLAGAYPCLAFLSAVQDKIKTIRKAVKISLYAAVINLHQAGGKLINVLMQVSGGDAFAVVNMLKREGVPSRLAGYTAFLPDALPDLLPEVPT